MYGSRGGESGKAVELSSKTQITSAESITIPRSISFREKGATGYHRKYAMWLLNHAEEVKQTPQRSRPRYYGQDARPHLLKTLANWAFGKPGRMPMAALPSPGGKARVAADMMNRAVITIAENASVQETIECMIRTGRRSPFGPWPLAPSFAVPVHEHARGGTASIARRLAWSLVHR